MEQKLLGSVDITLIRHPDYEGDDNRGFRVDFLELLVDAEPAGYLSLIYVPFHRLLSWNGPGAARTAVEWAASISGVTAKKFLSNGSRLGVLSTVDRRGLEKVWARIGQDCNIEGGCSVDFHVDRPLVDYIRIYKPSDNLREIPSKRFNSRGLQKGIASRDFRHRELGLLLYVEGARWMAENGMLLHASGLQQPEAKRAWTSLEHRFPDAIGKVIRHGYDTPPTWRTVLDGNKLPQQWLPKNTTSFHIEHKSPGLTELSNNLHDLSQGMIEYMNKKDSDSRALGREPLGGEPMPPTPAAAIEEYGRAIAARPLLEIQEPVLLGP